MNRQKDERCVVYLTSYSRFQGKCNSRDEYGKEKWFNLILDEADSVKNPKCQARAKIVALSVVNRIFLTGILCVHSD